MLRTDAARPPLVYKFECEDGRCYVVYNAAVFGNPADHAPDRWYARPYPVPTLLMADFGEPFETAEEAVQPARARNARVDCVPTST